MINKNILVVLVLVLALSGCAKLTHLQQLLTLKAMGDNKDLQEAYVQHQNEQFEKLLKIVKEDSIKEYRDQESIRQDFGEPLYTKQVFRRGEAMDRWLYRYSAKFKNPEKVYLYFNRSGKLVYWEHRKPKS